MRSANCTLANGRSSCTSHFSFLTSHFTPSRPHPVAPSPRHILALCVVCGLIPASAAEPARYFKIQVIDDQTDRGVPLVELRTTANARYLTDSNGIVAFFEPGLMDQWVFFHVQSHGYEFPKDGFGYAGKALQVKPGGSAQIKIKRKNIAERLYRITGAGIYRDSVLVGQPAPIRQPLLNGQVTGQDSVLAVPYRGRIYWFWGDTNRVRYPLGQFKTSGATSPLPAKGGLDPSVGVDLEYFVDKEGFSRPMCPIAGPGVVWIDGVLTVRDASGRERLVCHYDRRKGLAESLEHGLALYNDQAEVFEKHVEFDLAERWRCPRGHPMPGQAERRHSVTPEAGHGVTGLVWIRTTSLSGPVCDGPRQGGTEPVG